MLRRDRRLPAGQGAPAGPSSPDFRIANYPFYLIARVGGLYTRRLERALKPRGMNQPQWRVLMILAENDGASMGLVAELAVMKLPTLLKVVRKMADCGLVHATPRPSDQRFVDLRLTHRGRRELVHVKGAAESVYAEAVAGLDVGTLCTLNDVLRQFESHLIDEVGRARPRRRRRAER